MASLSFHHRGDQGSQHSLQKLPRKLFNYCRAKGKTAPDQLIWYSVEATCGLQLSQLLCREPARQAVTEAGLWTSSLLGLYVGLRSSSDDGIWDRSQPFIHVNPRQSGMLITGRNLQQGGKSSGGRGGAMVNCQGPWMPHDLVGFPSLLWLTCSRLSIIYPGGSLLSQVSAEVI